MNEQDIMEEQEEQEQEQEQEQEYSPDPDEEYERMRDNESDNLRSDLLELMDSYTNSVGTIYYHGQHHRSKLLNHAINILQFELNCLLAKEKEMNKQ